MNRNVAPLKEEYLAIAKVLQMKNYSSLSLENFVEYVIFYSEGNLDKKRLRNIYYNLMRELP